MIRMSIVAFCLLMMLINMQDAMYISRVESTVQWWIYWIK